MGRTKRKRSRKKTGFAAISLDNDSSIIALKRWMKLHNWKNTNLLKLSIFKATGRGLTAPIQTLQHSTLIEVPYELMITYTTLENSFLCDALLPSSAGKLKIHDLLSIFLVFEQHKGCSSKWKAYMDSLPDCIPPLAWLCDQKEIEQIPEELQSAVREKLLSFKGSWQRSKESIDPRWKCECCETPGHRVLTLNSFTWAYVMVNTRAVYVDPNIVRGLSHRAVNNLSNMLSDDPCMALCPYLDMFNHSNTALTDATLKKINEKWVFSLVTLTPSKKYEEILISYGFHDNIKLLCEYGFFIPGNELDVISFDLNEIIGLVQMHLNKRQYIFIHKQHLNRELNVSANGASFNLKAVLFVILNGDISDWCPQVFSANYSKQQSLQMFEVIKQLLQFKTDNCVKDICSLTNMSSDGKMSNSFVNIINYFEYRLTFMKNILGHISQVFYNV